MAPRAVQGVPSTSENADSGQNARICALISQKTPAFLHKLGFLGYLERSYCAYSCILARICYNRGMDIFLTHKSALEYWRTHGDLAGSTAQRLRGRKAPSTAAQPEAWPELKAMGLSYPLDVTVSEAAARSRSRMVRSHLFSGTLQEGCVVKVSEGLFVSSPELCFFQMAAELDFVKQIELGFELCGFYSLLVSGFDYADTDAVERGFCNLIKPLTSKKKLEAAMVRMAGSFGQRPLAKTLRYLVDGSASPMETILTMFLTLPFMYGGYGLPLPDLNRPGTPERPGRREPQKSAFRSDLSWPKTNVAVEYDSDAFHTGAQKIAQDSVRRNVLTTSGKRIITVTKGQVFNVLELDIVASQIAQNLGLRLRNKRSKGFSRAQQDLRSALLASPPERTS